MAFQVVDDILDFTGDAREMGKPVGGDLMQGTLTLPAMMFMERNPRDELVQQIFEARGDRAKVDRVIQMVRESTILDECYKVAAGFCDQARHELEGLPDKDCRKAMSTLADFVVERRS